MLRKHKKLTKKELKRDPLLIFIAQASDYLRNEWLKITSVVVTVAVIVAVAFAIISGRRNSAINAYDAALEALNNNAPEATELLNRLVTDHGGTRFAEEALILLGDRYYQNGDYESAERYYRQYIDEYSGDPIYAFHAYNTLGGLLEEQERFEEAAEIYESFTRSFSNSAFLPVMYLNAGKAYYHAGDPDAARENLSAVVEKYPDSAQTQDAKFFLEMADR